MELEQYCRQVERGKAFRRPISQSHIAPALKSL